jgi:hypothetical protein
MAFLVFCLLTLAHSAYGRQGSLAIGDGLSTERLVVPGILSVVRCQTLLDQAGLSAQRRLPASGGRYRSVLPTSGDGSVHSGIQAPITRSNVSRGARAEPARPPKRLRPVALRTLRVVRAATVGGVPIGLPVPAQLWPDAWMREPTCSPYEPLIGEVYVMREIVVLMPMHDPLQHLGLVWFPLSSTLVRGGIMAVEAAAGSAERERLEPIPVGNAEARRAVREREPQAQHRPRRRSQRPRRTREVRARGSQPGPASRSRRCLPG